VVAVIEVVETLSTGTWPLRLLTLEDWESMPEDELHHVEVSEGVLSVAPSAGKRHQRAQRRLSRALEDGLPSSMEPFHDLDVLLSVSPFTVRRPDIVVADRVDQDAPRLEAAEARLVVEIVSPGSRRTDTVTKPSEYAEAGIPEYWVVDLDLPVTLRCFRLIESTYELVGEHRGLVKVPVAGVALTLDLDALPTA
jgi:Uma2 family endonuclease